jgi:ATP dependent DNA ligase domain
VSGCASRRRVALRCDLPRGAAARGDGRLASGVRVPYTTTAAAMLTRSPFIEPCLPSPAERPPSGPDWIHEIKHDGYRLMARRDPAGTRLLTRNGYNWATRFPVIVEAVDRLKVRSCLIDGEAVVCDRMRSSPAPPWIACSASLRAFLVPVRPVRAQKHVRPYPSPMAQHRRPLPIIAAPVVRPCGVSRTMPRAFCDALAWLPLNSARVSNLPACCALTPLACAVPCSCRHEPCNGRSA